MFIDKKWKCEPDHNGECINCDNWLSDCKFNNCIDPAHNPPSHILIPFNKVITYKCPSCGQEYKLAG